MHKPSTTSFNITQVPCLYILFVNYIFLARYKHEWPLIHAFMTNSLEITTTASSHPEMRSSPSSSGQGKGNEKSQHRVINPSLCDQKKLRTQCSQHVVITQMYDWMVGSCTNKQTKKKMNEWWHRNLNWQPAFFFLEKWAQYCWFWERSIEILPKCMTPGCYPGTSYA